MNKAIYAFTALISGLVLIGAGCNIHISTPVTEAPAKETPDATQKPPVFQNQAVQNIRTLPTGWQLYEDQLVEVSYGYPKDFALALKQRAPEGVVHDIIATSFEIPQSFITGTNLSKDSAIFVYNDCLLKNMEQAESKQVVKNGKTFTEYSKFSASADNQYNAVLISQKINGTCLNVLLFMHSVNAANLPPGQVVTQFDHAQLTNIAYGMAESVQSLK